VGSGQWAVGSGQWAVKNCLRVAFWSTFFSNYFLFSESADRGQWRLFAGFIH
jgi:hypothetical protein